jgi:hypothetical protein
VTDIAVTDSMFLGSDALGTDGVGGGLYASPGSSLALARVTFAGNGADDGGGALAVIGSRLDVSASAFLGNVLRGPQAQVLAKSHGAAIFSRVPTLAANPVTGTVRGSTFLDQVGLPWFEFDAESPPINDLRYDGNHVSDGTFGSRVYASAPFHREGLSVEQLNALVVVRTGAPPTDKSSVDNTRALPPLRTGALMALPRAGMPGVDVAPQLAFAWSGGSATLGGQPLLARQGLAAAPAAGPATLVVDGVPVASAQVDGENCTSGPVLCLAGDRFRVDLRWRTPDGLSGAGIARALAPRRGAFSIAGVADAVDVQLIDRCATARRFWLVVRGPLARLVELTVLDTWSGETRELASPGSNVLGLVRDRQTFDACGLSTPPEAP